MIAGIVIGRPPDTRGEQAHAMKHGIVVAQLGSRMHYAVPQIFARNNTLVRMYTDFLTPRLMATACSFLPAGSSFRGALSRRPAGVESQYVTAFNRLGFEHFVRSRRAKTPTEVTNTSLWVGKQFCSLVIKRGLMGASAVYTFNSAGLEVLNYAKAQGLKTIMEQTIAPVPIQNEILKNEEHKFPNWEPVRASNTSLAEFADREAEEWNTSDIIVCGSKFVADGISKCTGPVKRCKIVPYGFDSKWTFAPRFSTHNPVRVLIVGTVSLRKGAPYVMAAARLLEGLAEFRMVGSVALNSEARIKLAQHVALEGPVSKADMAQHYEWADIFLLPSVCEGSATVCYEALSAGLPVITTLNSGSIVRDQLDGYIISAGDEESIASRIEHLSKHPDVFALMSKSALHRSREFSVEEYGRRLAQALETTE